MNQNDNTQKLKHKLEARRLFNEKNYEEALKFYRTSIESQESNPEQQIQYICQCLAKLGRFDELEYEYEQYYLKYKDDFALYNLVLLKSLLLQFDKAEDYQQKLKKDYYTNIFIESQVIIYFYQRKYKEAEEELNKVGYENLDEFMLYILLGQIQYITKQEVQQQYLKNQQLHLILKAVIEFDDLPESVINEQFKYDKVRQQFYQDIKQKQINSLYFEIKRYAYFEPFEQEFLLRQSQSWETSISKQINYFHSSMGKLTLVQQKFIQIYNNKNYRVYFQDIITVFNEFSNISQQLQELIQTTQLDKQQLEQVKVRFLPLENQIMTDNEIQEIIFGIEESIEERIQFIGDQQFRFQYIEKKEQLDKRTKQINYSSLVNPQVNQSQEIIEKKKSKDLFQIRQGTIDSYLILFMRQRNSLELNKDLVRDFVKFSLVKMIQ